MVSISSTEAIWPASTWAGSPGSIRSMKKSSSEIPISTGIIASRRLMMKLNIGLRSSSAEGYRKAGPGVSPRP